MPSHFPPSAWSLHADDWQRMTAEHDGGSMADHTIEMFPDAPVDLPRRVWQAERSINLALQSLDDLAGLVSTDRAPVMGDAIRAANRHLAGAVLTLIEARAILTGEEPDALERAA